MTRGDVGLEFAFFGADAELEWVSRTLKYPG